MRRQISGAGIQAPKDAAGSSDPIARPRVLHLDHTAAPGGAELALVRMLSADPPWRAAVLTPPTQGPAFDTLPPSIRRGVCGIPQRHGVSSARRGAPLAATARLLVQAVATRLHAGFRGADLVAANTARAAAYGALAVVGSRKPFVVHLRDLVDPAALGGSGHALMTRLVLPRADGVVANSRRTLETALPFLRADAHCVVIPSAAGLRPASARDAADTARVGRVGMLARIDPWKGQALLIEAFAAAFPDEVVLEIAGSAPFGHEGFAEELAAQAARLGIADRVVFLGHVDDVPSRLARWDVAVQYSTRPEPLGQNVLQYLAAGCAVVVADEGGPAEWVEDGVNGIRVPPRDPAALAGALRRLGEDSGLRRRLAEGARLTPGLLTDAEVTRAHAAFYAEVLRSRRPTRGRARPSRRASSIGV